MEEVLGSFLKFVGIVSQSLDDTKAKAEVPSLLFAFGLWKFNLEANLILWVCISEDRVRVC